MIYWLFISAMFSHTVIFPGFTLGDSIACCIICMVLIKSNFKFLSPGNHVNLFLLIQWAVLNGALIYMMGLLDVSENAKSLIKLIFYVVVFCSAYTLLRTEKIETVSRKLTNVLTINAVVAIYIYIAMNLNLPFEFFWYGMDIPITTAYYGGHGFVRARGIFSEPANLGYFLVMGMAFLLLSGHKLKKKNATIIWLSILLTFSVTTYFIACVVVLLHFRGRIRVIIKAALVAGVIFVAAYSIPSVWDSIQVSVVNRVVNVISGEAGNSSSTRLFGTWDVAITNLKESYLLGSGLGNNDISYARVNDIDLSNNYLETQNVLSYITGTLGIIGLVIFLSLFKVFRDNKQLGIVFFVSFFINGNFLSITFWVFYSIYSTVSKVEISQAKQQKQAQQIKQLQRYNIKHLDHTVH